MPRLYTIVNCSCSTEWMSLVTYHLRSLLRDDDRRRSTVLGHTRQVHFHSRLARLNPRRIWDARQRCGEKFSSTKHERAVGKLQSVKCKKKNNNGVRRVEPFYLSKRFIPKEKKGVTSVVSTLGMNIGVVPTNPKTTENSKKRCVDLNPTPPPQNVFKKVAKIVWGQWS